jgi:peptidoglycan hydrolase-like protein with peptidoglycan-binding domain
VTLTLINSSGALKADGSVASPAQETPTYKTLKRGMTNNDVKLLQQALTDLGYFSSNATGYFGTQTQLAVESFQKANNLKADGVAGAATLEKLFSSSAKSNTTKDAPATATTKYDTLKEGMKSSAVTTMQKKLKALGYMSENATGYFGSVTKKAVTDFQRASNIRADGIAGQTTLALLYGDNPVLAGGSSSGSGSTASGAGKISGPSPSSVKLLHWYDSVKPSLRSNSIVQVFDPVTKYTFNLKTLSPGRHLDAEPMTADDTRYMNAAFGGVTTWTPRPVWVKLPNGTWTLATMHNVPHLSSSVPNNNFNGHLCVHFLRDLSETQRTDPNYGMQHQKAIREAWKNLSGQTVN